MRITDLTKERVDELLEQYGSAAEAARHTEITNSRGGKLSWNSKRQMLIQVKKGTQDINGVHIYDDADADKLNRIRELLDRANIPLEAVGKIENVKLKAWGVHAKDPVTGKIVTEGMYGTTITLSPTWDDGPAWPVVQPAKPTVIKAPAYRPRPRVGRTVVVVPDVQVGFLRCIDDPAKLVPIHDREALAVALDLVADIQPDQIVHVGDFLDLPEMSRWLQHEEFWRTTQPAIDEGHKILAEFEAAAGPRRARTQFIAGNHDRRIREYTLKNARAAYHLRPAMPTPESWPDLTIPHLLRFDELGIDYCGEYPGSEFWITPSLVVRHNPEHKDAYRASVIAGHSHHIKRETFSRRSINGTEHHTLYEIGCLCRIDTYSDKGALLRTSVPSDRGFIKSWTQGLCVVHIDDDEQFSVDQVEIINGKALYQGRSYGRHAKTVAEGAA